MNKPPKTTTKKKNTFIDLEDCDNKKSKHQYVFLSGGPLQSAINLAALIRLIRMLFRLLFCEYQSD